MGHEHRSPGIENQGDRSTSRLRVTVNKNGDVAASTSIFDLGQFLPPDAMHARY